MSDVRFEVWWCARCNHYVARPEKPHDPDCPDCGIIMWWKKRLAEDFIPGQPIMLDDERIIPKLGAVN